MSLLAILLAVLGCPTAWAPGTVASCTGPMPGPPPCPQDWAWWRLEFEQAGRYALEVYLEPTFSLFDRTRYVVVADGVVHPLQIDQGAGSGWTALGEFDFAAGGDQFLAVFDDASGNVASGHGPAPAWLLVLILLGCFRWRARER